MAATLPAGHTTCRDWAVITMQRGRRTRRRSFHARRRDIYEVKTIRVPEGFPTGGGDSSNGNGPNAARQPGQRDVAFLADFSAVGDPEQDLPHRGTKSIDKEHFHASQEIVSLQFSNDALSPDPDGLSANPQSA